MNQSTTQIHLIFSSAIALTFRRWRDRYEAEGAEGLYDRRLGRASARRAGVDEKARVRVHEYPDHTLAIFHGPRCLARYRSDGQPFHTHTREAA